MQQGACRGQESRVAFERRFAEFASGTAEPADAVEALRDETLIAELRRLDEEYQLALDSREATTRPRTDALAVEIRATKSVCCPRCERNIDIDPAKHPASLQCSGCGSTWILRADETRSCVRPETEVDATHVPLDRAGGQSDPAVIGAYEIIEELARGGMGVVSRAPQRSLNRTVSLKRIRAGGLAGAAEVSRFHAEAQAAGGSTLGVEPQLILARYRSHPAGQEALQLRTLRPPGNARTST